MAAMDCGPSKMPNSACFPARMQSHTRNQPSTSSSLNHDAMAFGDAIPEPIPSPRRWSPTYQPRRRTSRHYPTSLSFVQAPTLPRAELHDHYSMSLPRRPADRGPSCISPFRSVRRMKEPFPLMLPSSPVSASSHVSVSWDSAPSLPTRQTPQSTKPPAGHALRTWRSDQNLTSASMAAFGLMPSPPISESRPASSGPDASYFDRKSEETPAELENLETTEGISEVTNSTEDNKHQDSTDHVDVLQHTTEESNTEEKSPYQPYRPSDRQAKSKSAENRRTDVTNVHEAHSNLIRQCEETLASTPTTKKPDKQEPTPVTSPASLHSAKASMPTTSPRPQRPRATTVSSEASWIPSNFSYCETWLQGVPLDPLDKDDNPKEFNRRKFQIIEQDPPMPKLDIIPGARTLDEPVVSLKSTQANLSFSTSHTNPSFLTAICRC